MQLNFVVHVYWHKNEFHVMWLTKGFSPEEKNVDITKETYVMRLVQSTDSALGIWDTKRITEFYMMTFMPNMVHWPNIEVMKIF